MDYLYFDTLCRQAADYVRASLDTSCSGLQRHLNVDLATALKLQRHVRQHHILQGMETSMEPWAMAFRMTDPDTTHPKAWIELVTQAAPSAEPSIFTAAEIPLEAARFLNDFDPDSQVVKAPYRTLKAIMCAADKSWWTTACSSGYNAAEIATQQACHNLSQHGCRLTSANGLLIVLELSGNCQLVDTMKTVLDYIKERAQYSTEIAVAVIEHPDTIDNVHLHMLVTKSSRHDAFF